jgi:hypothetical protein
MRAAVVCTVVCLCVGCATTSTIVDQEIRNGAGGSAVVTEHRVEDISPGETVLLGDGGEPIHSDGAVSLRFVHSVRREGETGAAGSPSSSNGGGCTHALRLSKSVEAQGNGEIGQEVTVDLDSLDPISRGAETVDVAYYLTVRAVCGATESRRASGRIHAFDGGDHRPDRTSRRGARFCCCRFSRRAPHARFMGARSPCDALRRDSVGCEESPRPRRVRIHGHTRETASRRRLARC